MEMPTIKLKALTLNCWLRRAVPVKAVCKKKNERLAAIREQLAKSDFDIVFLQEIWTQLDYDLLKDALSECMPFAHHFKSGYVGSGLCVFSRHQILATSQYRFSVNGYAHKFLCADWYGQKSVGLVRLVMQPSGLRVNAYITHLHAQYSPESTFHSYDSHRCMQAVQLATVVKETGHDCDVVLLAGDFNITTNQIGYELIRSIAAVEDSWRAQTDIKKAMVEEATCCRLDNSFHSSNTTTSTTGTTTSTDAPVRIDYFFHRANPGHKMTCTSCQLGMRRMDGGMTSYSDHEGVVAEYEVQQGWSDGNPDANKAAIADDNKLIRNLKRGIEVLREGVADASYYRRLWLSLHVACVAVLVMLMILNFGNGNDSGTFWVCLNYIFLEFLKVGLVIFAVFSFFHGALVLRIEGNNTQSVIDDMQKSLAYLATKK